MTDAPDASVKLRTVLDYLPCEACLAQPVKDQELLCSVCRRLDREVGVRIAVRRTVILERPSEPEPVVIQPPVPAAPATQPLDVVLRVGDEPLPDPREGVVQVVLEPLVDEEPVFADAFGWDPADDAFEFVKPAPAPEPAFAPPAEVPQDEYVFAPPPPEEPAPEPEPVAAEDWMPTEDVPVQQESDEAWAPPAEEPQPEPEPDPLPPEEEPILEATIVEEEEPVEMEVLEDEPEPAAADGDSDLWRLRGFDRASEEALRAANITAVTHLSGHDAGELASRTGLAAERLAPWVQVADLVQEAGVPLDAAIALVTAGIRGPKGLRELTAESVVERTHAFAGRDLAVSDVRRWKRRV